MKYPKLKHTVLCQVLLYLPGISCFLWLAALALIPGEWKECVPLMLGIFFALAAFSVWYLFYNFAVFMASDCLFSVIRQWKKDREEYRTDRNGTGTEKIRKTILRRCALWGKRFETQTGNGEAVRIYYRHGYSWTVFWSAIEKRVAVCTVDTLTAEQYHLLSGQARRMLSAVPAGKVRFRTKEERNAPCAKVNVVVFLADTVEQEVRRLARKPIEKRDDLCIIPCAVQCSDGRYYTDCSASYYEPGMMGCQPENYAFAMIRKLVFAGRLPKENRETQPAPDFAYEIEMSLWEYCRKLQRSLRDADDTVKKDRKKAYRSMRNGETRVGDGAVWYKQNDRLAEYAFLPEDEDETRVVLIPDQSWYYRKDAGLIVSLMSGVSFNRRKMKKGEAEQVKRYMEAALVSEGYQIVKD